MAEIIKKNIKIKDEEIRKNINEIIAVYEDCGAWFITCLDKNGNKFELMQGADFTL